MNLSDFDPKSTTFLLANFFFLNIKGYLFLDTKLVFFCQLPKLLARLGPLLALWSLFSPFWEMILWSSLRRVPLLLTKSAKEHLAPFYLNFWKKVTSPNDQDGWRSCLLHGQSVMRGQNLVELGWDSRNQALWPSSQGGLQTCSPATFQSFSNNLN